MRYINKRLAAALIFAVMGGALVATPVWGQQPSLDAEETRAADSDKKNRGPARPVVIQITPRVKGTSSSDKPQSEAEVINLGNITILEDGQERKVLSMRGVGQSPLALAVLIQDDVVSSISNEIRAIGDFIRTLPKGSRVMVGYIKSGTLQVRQKFTDDLDKAIRALRIPISSATAAPFNPYVEIIEGLKRFESLPSGRRAMLVVTDGLDTSRGISSSSAGQSMDLQRAIREAQRRSVAIYSFYAPTVTATAGRNMILVGNAQSSLERLSDESGGRAFFQGTGAPVSFDPFLHELGESLFSQIAVTFLSTSSEKGFHRLEVIFERKDVEVDYPAGYTR